MEWLNKFPFFFIFHFCVRIKLTHRIRQQITKHKRNRRYFLFFFKAGKQSYLSKNKNSSLCRVDLRTTEIVPNCFTKGSKTTGGLKGEKIIENKENANDNGNRIEVKWVVYFLIWLLIFLLFAFGCFESDNCFLLGGK